MVHGPTSWFISSCGIVLKTLKSNRHFVKFCCTLKPFIWEVKKKKIPMPRSHPIPIKSQLLEVLPRHKIFFFLVIFQMIPEYSHTSLLATLLPTISACTVFLSHQHSYPVSTQSKCPWY